MNEAYDTIVYEQAVLFPVKAQLGLATLANSENTKTFKRACFAQLSPAAQEAHFFGDTD